VLEPHSLGIETVPDGVETAFPHTYRISGRKRNGKGETEKREMEKWKPN